MSHRRIGERGRAGDRDWKQAAGDPPVCLMGWVGAADARNATVRHAPLTRVILELPRRRDEPHHQFRDVESISVAIGRPAAIAATLLLQGQDASQRCANMTQSESCVRPFALEFPVLAQVA